MKDDSIQHQLYIQLQSDIDRVQKLQHKYRTYYYWFRGIQIGVTGIITISSGFENVSHIFILCLGAFVTAITAIETLFRFDTLKDSFSLMLFDYRLLRDEFVFNHIQGRITKEFEKDVFDRYVKAKSGHRRTISAIAPNRTSESLGEN